MTVQVYGPATAVAIGTSRVRDTPTRRVGAVSLAHGLRERARGGAWR